MPGYSEHEKKPVPQIEPKTGLSHDYYSECALFNCYDPKKDSAAIDNLIVDLRDGVFEERRFVARHYEQKFPPTEFRDVVTNENKERVAKINAEVDKVNDFYKNRILPHVATWSDPLSLEDRTTVEEFAKALVDFLDRITEIVKNETSEAYKARMSKNR